MHTDSVGPPEEGDEQVASRTLVGATVLVVLLALGWGTLAFGYQKYETLTSEDPFGMPVYGDGCWLVPKRPLKTAHFPTISCANFPGSLLASFAGE